jgi:hypothetical protein
MNAAAAIAAECPRIQARIEAALSAAGLDNSVELEGPNKLGGFRLVEGDRRVALSRIPLERPGDRARLLGWCVSTWHDVDDGSGEGLLPIAPPVRRHQREQILGATRSLDDAILAAIEVLLEARIEAAWRRSGSCACCCGAGSEAAAAGYAPEPASRSPEIPLDFGEHRRRGFSVFRTARAFRSRHPQGR